MFSSKQLQIGNYFVLALLACVIPSLASATEPSCTQILSKPNIFKFHGYGPLEHHLVYTATVQLKDGKLEFNTDYDDDRKVDYDFAMLAYNRLDTAFVRIFEFNDCQRSDYGCFSQTHLDLQTLAIAERRPAGALSEGQKRALKCAELRIEHFGNLIHARNQNNDVSKVKLMDDLVEQSNKSAGSSSAKSN